MRRTSPKPGLLAWWSTTTEVPAASTSTASSPRRPGEAASRLTNTSGEDGTADEGTNPSAPGSQPGNAGSVNGSGNVARKHQRLRRSPSASAGVLPRASASCSTCPERTTVARASAASLSTDEAVRRGETASRDVVTGTGSGVRSGVGDRGCVLLLLHGAASHRVAAAVVRLVGGDARRIADLTVLAAVRRVSRVRRPAATQHGRAPTLVGLVGIGIVLAHDCSSLALVAAARGAAVPIGSLARSLTTAPRWRSSPPLAALLCPLVRSHARSRPLLAGARRRRSRRCCAHWFARTLAHDRSSLALVAAARGAAVPIGSLARSLTTAPRWRSSPPLAALLCPLVRSHARSRPLLAGARRRRSRRCCAHWFARTLAHDRSSLALVAAARGAAVPIGSLARSLTTAPRWRSSPP